MTDQTAAEPNVSRGITFALLAIPVAIIAFVLIASLFGFITGLVAIAVPYVSAWLYGKGAGAPLTRPAWGPWIGVTVAAIVAGILSGFVAAIYKAFAAVGGDGGPLGSVFLSTLGRQFSAGLGENAISILFGLALGGVGIAGVLRTSRALDPQSLPTMAPDAAAPVAPTQAAPIQPPAAQAPPAPPAPNQPSPGIMLNGKPLDPDKK